MGRSEIERFFSDDDDRNTELLTGDDTWGTSEGQLSIDMYQTDDHLIIQAPVAGVKEEDLEVSVDDGVVTIRGKREREHTHKGSDHFIHECYWGSFTRVQSLPIPVMEEKAEAKLKHSILTITVPKAQKTTKGRSLKIKTE